LAITNDLKKFWASNIAGDRLVNTFRIEVFDTTINSLPPNLANRIDTFNITDYGQTFTATLEAGSIDGAVPIAFEPIPMEVQLANLENSTQQSLRLAIGSLDGQIYEIVKDVAAMDRITTIILVTFRVYLESDTSIPSINPPSQFTVLSATASLTAVSLDLSVANMPTRLAGQYYTTDRFPGLLL
jgi:hypothetical protein